ncbi:MAG: prepilin-type N-terminal cleavage/methylation domain-containing protein [Actinomycetota bacterium]|nr:prepilin-type N-terminal cleavage/methylation domain-containing protein [Actinomycetota bacterium]
MRRLLDDQRGLTLPEVLIAMVITGVVTSVLLMGTVSVYRGHNFTQQDSASLGALRTSLDRFEKEVRQARIMYNDSTDKLVHVWVDYDRDNQQDPVERILWEIEDLGSNRAQLTRDTEGSDPVVVSRNLVFDAAAADFEYNNAVVEEASMITVQFVARAAGSLAGERTVTTRVRLRNASF